MRLHPLLIFIFIALLNLPSFGQIDTTAHHNWNVKPYIFPTAIMTTGILLNNSTFKKTFQEKLPRTHTHLDDYLQFGPVALMYIADIAKLPARNNAFNQTKFLGISEVLTIGIVVGVKALSKVTRPDGSADNSFPSGHTAQAFVAGNVLFQEFKDTKPWLAYSGLVIASTTGVLRMTNNRHWISDVLTSAGLATIVTQLVYHFEPLKNWNPFEHSKVTCLPKVGDSGMGVVLVF